MSGTSSRLELLRFARRVVEQRARASLAQLDGWIAEEERREAERRRSDEMRPPAPVWLLQAGLNRANTDAVQTGECRAAAKSGRCRPVSREQALEALRHEVPGACTVARTRPWGLLE
ncbi:DUF6233 domain-containing protein [Streptomyces flaveolus]|uniref:DUF6233 domain-containing protein n=1 Tax=Streptomyces flaveolus TaxID=67297 RepID=UPI00340EA0BA